MASYQNQVMLGLKLESKDSIDGKLQTLIKTLNNTKIDLDINIKNSDVSKQLETLTNLANNFKNSLGGNISLGNINEIINQATSSMERLNGEVLKTRTVLSTDGNYGSRYSDIANGIGIVTKQAEILNKETKKWELTEEGKTTTIVNNAKIKQSIDDITNAQQRLNQLEQNGYANKNKIADLQNMFSNSNNFSSDNELKNYLNQVKQLETEEIKLIQIQKEELDLINQMANGREKAELKSQQMDRTNELKQAQAINKAKEEEYKLQQQIKNSETNSLTKDITSTISQVEKLQTKFGSKLPNNFVNSTIKDLNKMISELKEADNINFNGMRNNLNSVKSTIEQVTNQTKQLVASSNNSNGFFGTMSNFLSRVGVFYGVQQVVQEISQQFKNASEYTLTLDKNISNIEMITGRTKEQVLQVTNSFKELGSQLHTTNVEILAGAEEMMRAGYSDSDSEKMLENATIGAKISGQTTQQVSEQLITLKNSFNMSAESMSHVIDIFSKMDNTSATSFREIASAIQRTAYSAQEAGVPLETLTSYITTTSEKTRRSAETIGESYKTIFSRYQNIKLGNLDEDGKSINDTETAMNRIGISIRTSKGEFKDFNTVLEAFMGKIKEGSISQVDMLAGVQSLAGVRQKESLLALIQNMDALKKHQEDMTTATGSAKRMFDEVYSQSLDAKVNDLKRAFEGLYEKMLSSDSLKWLVTEMTQLVTALSNVDMKTIAFTASIGGAILVMSKLATLNKALMMGEAVTGLSKLIAVLTGMTTVKTTIDGVTNATKAMQLAQMGAIAQTEGLTGLKGAWILLSTGIKEATASALAFMATPIGMVITAIGVALGIAVVAFTSYQEHQADLTEQSKSLKTALEGVNEALKGGDTSKAQEEADKMKKAQEKLQQYIELRKKAEEADSNSFNPTGSGADKTSVIESYNRVIKEQIDVLKNAGLTVDEVTGKIKEFTEAEDGIRNTDIVNQIKEQTKAQLENRENLEGAKEEYQNFIKTTQDLYTEYQNLSAQENLSSEQKTRLGEVCNELQSKFADLNVSVDENGVAHINNTPLIEENISYLTTEGMTVNTLTLIREADSRACSTWSINNQQMTYQEVMNNIENYKTEIDALSKLEQARLASASASATYNPMGGQAFGSEMVVADNQYQEQLDKANDELKKYESAKAKIDSIYGSIKAPVNNASSGGSSSSGNYMPSGAGDSAKKAQQEAIKAEKEALDELTDAYNKAKSIIEDDINAIDTQLEELGDTDSDNFVQKVDLTNQKLAKQQEEVKLASDQLEKLKETSFSTAEGQDALESKILSANKELRQQTLEASKLHKELEKLEEEQLKKYYENQKEIETQKLEATQQAQNDKLDEIKQKQEDIHNAKMDYFDAELKALEEQNEAEDKANELQDKQIDLKQKEIDLERIKNQGIIQEYSKDANGNWGYSYTYDKDAYDKKQKEVDESKKSLEETKRKQKYEEEKKAIEDQKTAEEKLYKEKEDYLEKYSTQLKNQQDRDKKRIETYYSDIDSLTKTTLKSLEETYNNNWTAIANSISEATKKSKKEIEDLQTLSANFVASDVVKGILSGDVSGFIRDNQNKMNQQANVDENEIDNYFKTIDASANSANDTILKLSDSYKDLSVIKQENLNITDDDIKQNKKQVANITKIDYDGLLEQLKNLKEINTQIEKELDTHYNNELTRQNKAQSDEIDSFNKFAKEYLLKTNKLCELLQVVWDFRFSNIVTIVDNAGVIISQALEAWSIAYEDFAKIWNSMNDEDHQIANKIEIKDALSTIENTHTTVVQWETDKSKLYDQKTFEEFAKNIQGNIQDSLLNKLNNYSGTVDTVSSTSNSSVVNNKNNTTTSNVTNLSINQLDVNTKDAQNLLNQLLTLVNNKTNLS